MFFLYFLSHKELESVLESSRKRKSRNRELEKERERERARESDMESSRKRKGSELEWVYVCGGEKKKVKKERYG